MSDESEVNKEFAEGEDGAAEEEARVPAQRACGQNVRVSTQKASISIISPLQDKHSLGVFRALLT